MISPIGNQRFCHAAPPTARGTLRIAESFVSIQGEGKLTGTRSFFVRTSGCNLRCWFCDTPYASWNPSGDTLSIEQLIHCIGQTGLRHVVLTGGEPLVPKESVDLCRLLREMGYHITIETAGTVDRDIECDLLSISPKFASSAPDQERHPDWYRRHHQRRMPIETMRRLIDRAIDFQLKFVVDSPQDYDELLRIVERLGVDQSDVWIMPQGSTIEALDAALDWLKPWCEKVGYQYCDREQIRVFGNRRGT